MGLQMLNNFWIIQCFILSNIKTKARKGQQPEKLHAHIPFSSNSFYSFISFNQPNNVSRQKEKWVESCSRMD